MTLTMDRIAHIFGRRVTRRIQGKLATVLERMDEGHHVLRAYFKKSFVKQYEKWRTFLRLEVVSKDVKDLGLERKGLRGLHELRTKMKTAVGRFAETAAINLNNGGQYDVLAALARPAVQGKTKIAGIRIESKRVARLLALLLRGAASNLRGVAVSRALRNHAQSLRDHRVQLHYQPTPLRSTQTPNPRDY